MEKAGDLILLTQLSLEKTLILTKIQADYSPTQSKTIEVNVTESLNQLILA